MTSIYDLPDTRSPDYKGQPISLGQAIDEWRKIVNV